MQNTWVCLKIGYHLVYNNFHYWTAMTFGGIPVMSSFFGTVSPVVSVASGNSKRALLVKSKSGSPKSTSWLCSIISILQLRNLNTILYNMDVSGEMWVTGSMRNLISRYAAYFVHVCPYLWFIAGHKLGVHPHITIVMLTNPIYAWYNDYNE